MCIFFVTKGTVTDVFQDSILTVRIGLLESLGIVVFGGIFIIRMVLAMLRLFLGVRRGCRWRLGRAVLRLVPRIILSDGVNGVEVGCGYYGELFHVSGFPFWWKVVEIFLNIREIWT